MNRWIRRIGAVLLPIGLLTAAGAGTGVATAGTTKTADVRTYVGRLPGTNAFVGIAVSRSRVRAYVCDGEQISEWFTGSVTKDPVDITADDGARFAATITNKAVKGSVTLPDGTAHEFTVKPATHKAALYRGERVFDGKDVLAGWVVLADGRQRGVVGVKGTTTLLPAPQLTLGRTVRRGTVALEGGGGVGISCTGAGCSIRFDPGGGLGVDPGGGLGVDPGGGIDLDGGGGVE